MASEGKRGRDYGPAHGWDLFKWKWVAEPPEAFAAAVYGIFFLIFLFIVLSGIVALWALLAPIWTGASPVPSAGGADPGAELRGRLLIIGAVLTTPFLIWRLIVGHWSARAAQEQARVAQETARNTLFTKAIEQLGATREERKTRVTEEINGVIHGFHDETNTVPNTDIRLGAIYALEKLARDDIEMHWPIMETLCAYIRENAGLLPRPLDEAILSILRKPASLRKSEENEIVEQYTRQLRPPAVEVQAALSVIGRRSVRQLDYERGRREDPKAGSDDAWRLDFRGSHLSRANLKGLNLDCALLSNSVLSFAHCDDAHLDGAWLDGAAFEGAMLNRAHLDGAWLLGTHLEGAYLIETHLKEAHLYGAHLEGAQLSQAHFEDAFLNGSHLEGARLREAHLERAQLADVHFEDAHLNEAYLGGAFLNLTHLERAWLGNARLDGAWLHRVNLDDASLADAVLVDANIDGLNLETVRGLHQSQLDATWGDAKTKLPSNLQRPSNERWLPANPDADVERERNARWQARRSYWLADGKQSRQEGQRT